MTQGGSTDDFTNAECVKYVPGARLTQETTGNTFLYPNDLSLSDAMMQVMNDQSWMTNASKEARKMAEQFTWKHAAELFYNYFYFVASDSTGDVTRALRDKRIYA